MKKYKLMAFAFKSLLRFMEEEQIHNRIVLRPVIEIVENVLGMQWENDSIGKEGNFHLYPFCVLVAGLEIRLIENQIKRRNKNSLIHSHRRSQMMLKIII